MRNRSENGFALVFVIAVVSALSIMTSAMYFYYDNDLKSVSRNSVMQQVTLAAETGLQEGQKWIADQLNSNSFALVDIQNSLHIDDSNDKCLNRHGFTDATKDIFYAKKIVANLGEDFVKFQNVTYEVFIQRHKDIIRSIYFSEEGSKGNSDRDTDYSDRSFALVEKFKDFPTNKFTIEMWIKNTQPDSSYNMHLFEWGRTWDLVFKVKNDDWSPRLGEVTLDDQEDADNTVGTPIKDEWVHIAWVWDGGDPNATDTGNVKIYQNGELSGTFNADIAARAKSGYTNQPEILPEGDYWPLAIGEGLHGFSPNNYLTGNTIIQSVPWLGNVSEMRIWNIARTESHIANNNRRRLTGGEPGLVSYYKFNEGSGNIAKDYNTTRSVDRKNDATVYGIGAKGTLWKKEEVTYEVEVDNDEVPVINVPPGEDQAYYKILSCGNGPQGQIIPLELIVSAPVQKGDVGDGKIVLTPEDLALLTGQEGSPLNISLDPYIAQPDIANDIKVQQTNISNTNISAFKRSIEQCSNSTTFTAFNSSTVYSEEQCAEYEEKLWMLEKDAGTSSGDAFDTSDWKEVMGSGCDGVQFKTASGDASYGHYYKYYSTAPNVTSDLGYNGDSISWWEAKRRAEQSTCGGMRGYLVSIETLDENNFIKNSVVCNDSTTTACAGIIPFHVAAGKSRADYYGTRLDEADDEHYVWLANSDWRTRGTMRSESGPDLGQPLSFTNWQTSEPNGGSGGEDFSDMEINRENREAGGWNDLHLIPNCTSGGLDCITGYVVEYGGFDSFRLDHDDPNNAKDVSDNTKVCVARATIEKDKYVFNEDFLIYDSESEDALTTVSADTSTSSAASDVNTIDEWPGWDAPNAVLTLKHSSKPADWSPTSTYSDGALVWFNNRSWRNKSGGSITGGGSLEISQTPTIYNPNIWALISGNETLANDGFDAPCIGKDDWIDIFESIKYYNDKEVDAEDEVNPFAYEDTAGGETPTSDAADGTMEENEEGSASLGERVIIFSLGPLHVAKHLDGYNHFYEFYKFPINGNDVLYNNRNRRMGEGFNLSNRLHYFAKTGYLVTVTSEKENDIITEKAVGTGWMGAIVQTANQNSDANLNKCGGLRHRPTVGSVFSSVRGANDFKALRTLETMEMYRGGENYTTNTYLRNIDAIYETSETIISSITKASPAVVTSSNHGLIDDDIVHITDGDVANQANLDGMTQLKTNYYRVVKIDSNEFSLHHLDTRENIDSRNWGDYDDDSGRARELKAARNEYYLTSNNINNANIDPQQQANLNLFYKDPPIEHNVSTTTSNTDCPIWRWISGPEQFIYENRGLAFSNKRTYTENPSARDGVWTRANPSGMQIGEKFKEGMPFRAWASNEPNNSGSVEAGAHMLGTHFSANKQLQWNDQRNVDLGLPNDYAIRGLIIEYGGMENSGDPIVRIAAKRVIKLYDRRVTKAIITIKSGNQSGDKLVVGQDELNEVSLSATGNETSTITLSGDATCLNYIDTIKSIYFSHTGTTAGIREISVKIGDVKKPAGADHYYQVGDGSLNYAQADYQASYQNLCGIQGYLANVTTAADLTALSALGISSGKQAWVNGTDECNVGLFRPGFWRYTSGPWKEKEFWRLRSNIQSRIDINESTENCTEFNTLRANQRSVRVGPFESNNWKSDHPAANESNYLVFEQSTSKIATRTAAEDANVDSYIIRFGGSVGDFLGADVEEEDNNLDVILGPLKAEISFYTNASENSIFIEDEDKVDVKTTGEGALLTGWSRSQQFTSNSLPLTITPPSNQVTTINDWRRELSKVYYENLQISSFTPGNRRIKIKLIYGDISLNQEMGVVKVVGSRKKVTVSPESWSNR